MTVFINHLETRDPYRAQAWLDLLVGLVVLGLDMWWIHTRQHPQWYHLLACTIILLVAVVWIARVIVALITGDLWDIWTARLCPEVRRLFYSLVILLSGVAWAPLTMSAWTGLLAYLLIVWGAYATLFSLCTLNKRVKESRC